MKKGKKGKETVSSNKIIQHVWIDMPTGSKFITDVIFLVLFGVLGHTFDVGGLMGYTLTTIQGTVYILGQ